MTDGHARPSRIGIVVMQFPVRSETFIVTQVLGLLERGYDVQIFAVSPSTHWDSFAVLRGREDVRARVHVAPPFHGLPLLTRTLPFLIGKAIRHPAAFARYLAHCWTHRATHPNTLLNALIVRSHMIGFQPDLLHIEFDVQGGATVDMRDYFDCAMLLSRRGTVARTTLFDRWPERIAYLYRHADAYHFISQFLRAEAVDQGLDPDLPWRLIVPAIDLTLFAPRPTPHVNAPGAPLRILSVGRLDWAKGYEFALDAVAQARAAGIAVEYTILGEGGYREAIACAIEQHGLTDAVTLAGSVPREAVIGYLHGADLFLHTALEEGFANAVIEAQAAGLPVVTSDAGGLPENVEDGVTGLVVPRRDADATAEAIVLLAGDAALRQRMADAGRARALARYDLAAQIAAFDDFYRAILAAKG